jgi:ATP-dependent exoDNAse (exonuclease V) beta subunit
MELARARGDKYRIAVLGRTRNALAPVAQALREVSIPFRAVDLEKLQDRPEVIDALSLARALLNPQDRVSWLGVLRAPWCGLALSDLHLLVSTDSPDMLARPVPELLAERLPLLSEEGRIATGRVLEALHSVSVLRSGHPTAALGTWLEQVWLRLGGAACVDSTARANLNLLWNCLDHLPEGEQDLLGPALDAALDKLTAQPNPEVSIECGVQLMTIHKSKGLEFEVVIVPDMQAGSGRGGRRMLSWLERGLASPDDSGEITEFLIAPLQPKGADRGKAKQWVDSVYRQRESQEDRRILYVAATRAREELHLFARPACKVESDGSFSLSTPSGSLLATAWPALEQEVRTRFEEWKASRAEEQNDEGNVVEAIAASDASNLLVMPSPVKPTLLRRLPPNYRPEQEELGSEDRAPQRMGLSSGTENSGLYTRHEGGLLSRILGTAVHTLLEELARLRATNDWDASRAALQQFTPRIAAQVRAVGVELTQAERIAAQALTHALNASRDPMGQWILSPHPGAESEARWAGVIGSALDTVRVDRVFRAGLDPLSEGEEVWWIVDYKTAHGDNIDHAAALPDLRKLFAPQLAAYARILRNLHGQDTILRAGLYYPRMLLLDWWEL